MSGALGSVAVAELTSLPRGAAGLSWAGLAGVGLDWDRLDWAVVGLSRVVLAVIAAWLLLALTVAVGRRGMAGRNARIARTLDLLLALLAPGVAGRVLRAVVGVGAAGAALAGPLVATASAAQVTVSSRFQVEPPTAHSGRDGTTGAVASMGAPLTGRTADRASDRSTEALTAPDRGTTEAAGASSRTPSLWPLSTPLRAESDTGHAAGSRDVVVLRGDSLWSIAAHRLPADAPASRIDAGWRRIYAMNRTIVGADPNCLLPGQILRVPL